MNMCTHMPLHTCTHTHVHTRTLRGEVPGTPTALHVSHQRQRMPPSPSRILSSALGLRTRGEPGEPPGADVTGQCSVRTVPCTHIYSGECLATASGSVHIHLKKKGFHERIFGNHLVFNTIFVYKTPVSHNFLYTRTQASDGTILAHEGHRRLQTMIRAGSQPHDRDKRRASPSFPCSSGCSRLGPPGTQKTCVHKLLKS